MSDLEVCLGLWVISQQLSGAGGQFITLPVRDLAGQWKISTLIYGTQGKNNVVGAGAWVLIFTHLFPAQPHELMILLLQQCLAELRIPRVTLQERWAEPMWAAGLGAEGLHRARQGLGLWFLVELGFFLARAWLKWAPSKLEQWGQTWQWCTILHEGNILWRAKQGVCCPLEAT